MDNPSTDSFSMLVKVPTEHDVLCGRGRAIRAHSGNQRYIELIQDQRLPYENAQKGRKIDVVHYVVQTIHNEQGRFLQKQGDYWVEIGLDKAIVKTSQAFRDMRAEETNNGGAGTTSVDNNNDNNNKTKSSPPAVKTKINNKIPTPFNYNLLKKHAPAGRYAALLQRAKLKQSGRVSDDTVDQDKHPTNKSKQNGDKVNSNHQSDQEPAMESSEEDADKDNNDEESEDEEESEKEEEEDNDINSDVSDTETEDSFPVYRAQQRQS